MEISGELGIRQVSNAIKGRPIDYYEILVASVTTILGLKVPKMMAQFGNLNSRKKLRGNRNGEAKLAELGQEPEVW